MQRLVEEVERKGEVMVAARWLKANGRDRVVEDKAEVAGVDGMFKEASMTGAGRSRCRRSRRGMGRFLIGGEEDDI